MKTNYATKKTSWVVTAFYLLIVFEFFYMASPFAIYFYSVYKPGLTVLNHFSSVSWLTNFFLPHIAQETQSSIINSLPILGGLLLATGLLIFIVCASQVYYYKLMKNMAVTKGFYKIIRHPQYTGFALSSLGMLLIWPRFLVLITFIALLFVYYFLAKTEEKECETKFGAVYTEYKNRTFMFLPFRIPFLHRLSFKTYSNYKKAMIYSFTFICVIYFSVVLANAIRKSSVETLYVTYLKNIANLSITKISSDKISQILEIALQNHKVDSLIRPLTENSDVYFINYLLPANIYNISEIPMMVPDSLDCTYKPGNGYKNLIKVVFTKAIVDSKKKIKEKEILLHTKFTKAIVEVWVNTTSGKIEKIIYPPNKQRFENIPVPVF